MNPYGILGTFFADNRPQFVSKSFAALCTSLGTKLVTITECHPQSNGQVDRHNKAPAARLSHYIDDHQQDWDIAV